jgi:hypothetical protein
MPILRALVFLQRSRKYFPKKDAESVDLATFRSLHIRCSAGSANGQFSTPNGIAIISR